jgi:hypothetical protein
MRFTTHTFCGQCIIEGAYTSYLYDVKAAFQFIRFRDWGGKPSVDSKGYGKRFLQDAR